jgi:hypothetical protein
MIDDEHFDRAFLGFQAQAELLGQRGEEGRAVGIGRAGMTAFFSFLFSSRNYPHLRGRRICRLATGPGQAEGKIGFVSSFFGAEGGGLLVKRESIRV